MLVNQSANNYLIYMKDHHRDMPGILQITLVRTVLYSNLANTFILVDTYKLNVHRQHIYFCQNIQSFSTTFSLVTPMLLQFLWLDACTHSPGLRLEKKFGLG